MDLFNINCTTCKAKLQVRSLDVIGQILACPRCHSMVQVVPPPDWRHPGAASDTPADAASAPPAVQSAAVELNSPPANRSEPTEPAPSPAAQEGAPARVEAFAAPPALPAEPPHDPFASSGFEEQIASIAAPPVSEPARTPPTEELSPVTGPSGWVSPTEQLWRKIILGGAIAGTFLVVFGASLAFVLLRSQNETPAVAAVNGSDDPHETNLPDDAQDANPATTSSEPQTSAKEEPAPASEVAKLDLLSDVKPAEQPADAPRDAHPGDASPAETQEAASSDKPAAQPADPLSLLPDETPPGLPPSVEAVIENGAIASDEQSEAGEMPADVSLPRKTPVVERRSRSSPDAEPIDVAARLAETLVSIEFASAQLIEYVDFLTDMSLLPITLDLPALSAADVTGRTPVSVSLERASVAEALTAALTGPGLTYLVEEDQIIVTTRAAAEGKLRSARFRIDDLVEPGPDGPRELAALLQTLVAPHSWQTPAGGGPGKITIDGGDLVIEQSAPVMMELVIFCEQLRVARGLPTRSRLPAARLAIDTRLSQTEGRLEQPIGFTFHEPTRMVDVARFLRRASNLRMHFDWRSLARDQFAPDTEISCAIVQMPLAEALDEVLAPLNLAWRVHDADTIEIFHHADAAEKLDREFYPVEKLLHAISAEELQSSLRSEIGEDAWQGQGGPGDMYFDAPSGRLIVLHTCQAHRTIARLLAEQQSLLADRQ